MRGKMLLIISLAITGLIAAWAQSDSGCPAVHIEGLERVHIVSGRYGVLPTSANCSNRHVYKQNGGDRYMYFIESRDAWVIGSNICATGMSLYVHDRSNHPEKINETWWEWNSASGWFTENPNLEVKCDSGFNGCSDLILSGSTVHESYNGQYRVLPMSEMCYGRYSYKHISKNYYIYAGGIWFVGPVNCDRHGIKFNDGAFYPENIMNIALEYISTDNYTASPAKIICDGLYVTSTQQLISAESSTTVSQMATTEATAADYMVSTIPADVVSSDQISSPTTAVKNLEPIEDCCPVWYVITGVVTCLFVIENVILAIFGIKRKQSILVENRGLQEQNTTINLNGVAGASKSKDDERSASGTKAVCVAVHEEPANLMTDEYLTTTDGSTVPGCSQNKAYTPLYDETRVTYLSNVYDEVVFTE